ncbi:MAG: hypothetical protein ACYDD5_00510 [Sulfuricurvum sp.]
MTQETLAELRAKAQEALARGKEQADIMVEASKLNTVIKLNSDDMVVARVQARLKDEASDKLAILDTACAEIITSMPVYSSRTKENRKWNPSRQYGMGSQIATLTGLLSGIQYSASEHKAQMLALTGLSENLIEDTLAAFGNTSYYSSNYNVVVDEAAYNEAALTALLLMVEDALDITLDKTLLTSDALHNRFTLARLRAEKSKADVDSALATPTITIE